MASAWAQAGRIVVRKPGVTDYGVELGATADAEQRRHCDSLEQRPGVVIDLIIEPGIARGIGRREIVDLDRRAIRGGAGVWRSYPARLSLPDL